LIALVVFLGAVKRAPNGALIFCSESSVSANRPILSLAGRFGVLLQGSLVIYKRAHIAGKMFRTESQFLLKRAKKLARPGLRKIELLPQTTGLNASTSAAAQSCYQRDDEHHEENEEQELCNSSGGNRYATKSEDRGDDRNN
jgi:hypothetical protein